MSFFDLKEGIRKQLKMFAFASVLGLFLVIGLLYLHFAIEAKRKFIKEHTANSPSSLIYKAMKGKNKNG